MNTPPQFSELCAEVGNCLGCASMHHVHVLSPANGPLDARVFFVAEAPGRHGAAITGVPLSGDEAGRRFEAFLSIAGLSREEIFVTNAVLCNPLDDRGRNRTPTATEIARCRPFLKRTLDIVRAPVVVALGRVALSALRTIEPHDLALQRTSEPFLWRGRTLVALNHPGRQSTIHRSQEQQVADWYRLGTLLRPLTCHPSGP